MFYVQLTISPFGVSHGLFGDGGAEGEAAAATSRLSPYNAAPLGLDARGLVSECDEFVGIQPLFRCDHAGHRTLFGERVEGSTLQAVVGAEEGIDPLVGVVKSPARIRLGLHLFDRLREVARRVADAGA